MNLIKREMNSKELNMYEWEMSKGRVKDLETQLDRLLENSTDQRTLIEDLRDEIEGLKRLN